ncbi:UNVERIFIED_CONTAM: hypothetical protein Sradi_1306800 [Sesamum radiatum]|uniref:Uncharacterized protein n=1 Tax=Sesamum radiatum TaxID=300843 RepID=A0AAW2UQ27_SESRA
MAYVGHNSGREVLCDRQDCPAGCGKTEATPLMRMGDRGKHFNTSSTTRGIRYWILAVQGGLMAKTSGRGTTPHCGQIMKPRERQEGILSMSCGINARCWHIEWASDL